MQIGMWLVDVYKPHFGRRADVCDMREWQRDVDIILHKLSWNCLLIFDEIELGVFVMLISSTIVVTCKSSNYIFSVGISNRQLKVVSKVVKSKIICMLLPFVLFQSSGNRTKSFVCLVKIKN